MRINRHRMEYLSHLSKDKKLKRLIETQQPLNLDKRKDVPLYLIFSIISQQLSTKVAGTLRKRFLALYDGRNPGPEDVLGTSFETLRSIGLSNAKAGYVHNVARFAVEQGMEHRRLTKMDDEAIIAYLTQIKGVGRWTTEMLLMFCLGREDIFAIDDWGIQNAMIHLYKLDRTDKKAFREKLIRISGKWSPYRTYACLHLWRWKDNSPATGTGAAGAVVGKARPRTAKPRAGAAKSGARAGKSAASAGSSAASARKSAAGAGAARSAAGASPRVVKKK
jgi:DNA-3-methyladenine glycosylase II